MTLPAGLAHLGSRRGVMTDCTASLFVRNVAAMVEGYGAGARRQLHGGGRYRRRKQCELQQRSLDRQTEAHQFPCQASNSASASVAATVSAAIARAIHKRIVVASSDQIENFEMHAVERNPRIA